MIHDASIKAAADLYHLDPILITAIVQKESSGNQWAWNPEPRYRYLWDVRTNQPFRTLTLTERASGTPPLDFHAHRGDPDQEWWGQRASWGLMQVMGATARELGFAGDYIPQILHPETNLALGCKLMSQLLGWAKDTRRALAAYNAGRGGVDSLQGQNYATSVLKRMP